MIKSNKRNMALLVLTSFIWGTSFVAQSTGGDAIGAFSFNCIRQFVGALALLPVIKLLDATGLNTKKPVTKQDKKNTLTGGISCGIVLFFASNLQQQGITMGTGAGKAAFLTACYILLVPIFGIFLGNKVSKKVWAGVILTVIGLYFLCMNEGFSVQLSDILCILCAVAYAVHILTIDHFSPIADGVRMSCIQFFTSSLITSVFMFFVDMGHSKRGISLWLPPFMTKEVWVAIFVAGVLSCGVAYTLQIVGQNGVEPTIASMLLSLESVFSVIACRIVLHEYLGIKEIAGCVLIFVAIVLAQLPEKIKE